MATRIWRQGAQRRRSHGLIRITGSPYLAVRTVGILVAALITILILALAQ